MSAKKLYIVVGVWLAAFTLVILTGSSVQAQGTKTYCADEGGRCNFSGTKEVAYGAEGRFTTKTATNGINCNNSAFGDPNPGVTKSCYIVERNSTRQDFPEMDLSYREADPSANLSPEARRQLRNGLTSEGFDKLMQVAKYMYNSQRCLAGIGILLDTAFTFLPPGTSEACSGAINQVNDILEKYSNPPPVE
jgi:hypothetical protein